MFPLVIASHKSVLSDYGFELCATPLKAAQESRDALIENPATDSAPGHPVAARTKASWE